MRGARLIGAALAVSGAFVLSGCEKPLPNITVQDGAHATTVTPSTYCFDATHCRSSTHLDLPVITASVDDKILVDVPRDLVDKGWAVQAVSLDGKKAFAVSPIIRDSHSYRVASNVAAGRNFIVQVRQLQGGQVDASRWSFLVKVSGTT